MPLGPPTEGPLDSVPAASLGAPVEGVVDLVPLENMGPPIEGEVEYIPGASLGPPFDADVVMAMPDPILPIKDLAATARLKELVEASDAVEIAYIQRVTSGPACLWDDDNVTTIQIGGGAEHLTTSIGKAGVPVLIGGALTVQDSSLLSGLPMELGSDSVLSLEGRSGSVPVNDAVDANLNTPFFSSTALSFVEAINEALVKTAGYLAESFTNDSGSLLVAGTCVYLSAQGLVEEADASADAAPANWLGVFVVDTAHGAAGKVAYEGEIAVKLAPGEGVGPHEKKPIYLATTAGFGTLTAPSGSGEVILLLGYVIDDTGYDDALGGTMLVQTVRAQRRVNP